MQLQKIAPCLWFDRQAEEAARYYVEIFPDSAITDIARYTDLGPGPEGSVLTVAYRLAGQNFLALNGGPMFTFSHAISFIVYCDTQEELDHYWDRLSAGGEVEQCGWLRDRFGVSWQVVPSRISVWMSDPDAARVRRVMEAVLKMVKLEIGVLEAAYRGN
jgi:predicted 3-demethylubiquinone-9 3-methyltransferase (glyoxalase superfamily)